MMMCTTSTTTTTTTHYSRQYWISWVGHSGCLYSCAMSVWWGCQCGYFCYCYFFFFFHSADLHTYKLGVLGSLFFYSFFIIDFLSFIHSF
ncbi:hypothetical protein BKA57DRAFT_285986 [Linnemannia elongata]|nr:hypothetical protein BKA57DRAFT_285986 [Linnemannia elongata]